MYGVRVGCLHGIACYFHRFLGISRGEDVARRLIGVLGGNSPVASRKQIGVCVSFVPHSMRCWASLSNRYCYGAKSHPLIKTRAVWGSVPFARAQFAVLRSDQGLWWTSRHFSSHRFLYGLVRDAIIIVVIRTRFVISARSLF